MLPSSLQVGDPERSRALGAFLFLLMTKCAILIDGGYLLKRLPTVRPGIKVDDAKDVAASIAQLVHSHLDALNKTYLLRNYFELLYRVFYYDAKPYGAKGHTPIQSKPIDYSKTAQALFRKQLIGFLKEQPNVAVRLGEVLKDPERSWILKPNAQKNLLKGNLEVRELNDEDFSPALRQKGVDMRIGLDIASITLKRQADIIVLVSGDADFAPAAKLARREGVQFILDPLWQNISDDLSEHIDRLRSGFARPWSSGRNVD